MEIVLFGKYHGNHGPSRVTHGLSRALAQQGYSPTILTYGDRKDAPHPDVTVHRLYQMPSSVKEWYRLYRTVRKKVELIEPTVFHALERYPYYSDIRTVQWTSDMVVMWRRTGQRSSVRSLVGEVGMNWLSRSGVQSAKITVAQSPETERQMRQLWRVSPDTIIPLGIAEEFRTQPTEVNDPPRVLLVGRVEPRKGQRRLLQHLDPDTNDYELHIVGSITNEAYACSALHGWKKHYRGYLSDGELEREYEQADIVVVPSHLENFSMVGLEAIAKGCVLIITQDCGLAQFDWANSNNGIYVAKTGKELRKILQERVNSSNLRSKKSASFRLSDIFTWGNIAPAYIEKYNKSQYYE